MVRAVRGRTAPLLALGLTFDLAQVALDHHRHQLGEGDMRRPAQVTPRLGGVADQLIDLGGAQ